MTYSKAHSGIASDRVRQGEILSGVPEIVANPGTADLAKVRREYAIILTPDCDLERDWTARSEGKRSDLRTIALIFGFDARDRTLVPSSAWGRVKKNDQSSAHAVEGCPKTEDLTGTGIPPLVFQFKNVFTIPMDLLYTEIQEGNITRRSQILSPYREHLIQRFCSFFGRVALEVDHRFE